MRLLITGIAGFIGYHVAKRASALGIHVLGIDNLDSSAKDLAAQRLVNLGLSPDAKDIAASTRYPTLSFANADICDDKAMLGLARRYEPTHFCHLAAKTGVRESLQAPAHYLQCNILGFLSILEIARELRTKHCIFASSSSVYGTNQSTPFCETDRTDTPISPYAVSKKSDELLAYTYASLYNLPISAIRFFSVYGPWGRPDMAVFSFVQSLLTEQPIHITSHGRTIRDFTYIDDAVDCLWSILDIPPTPSAEGPALRIVNVGAGNPITLDRLVDIIEQALGVTANRHYSGPQHGDAPLSWADKKKINAYVGSNPFVDVETGVRRFITWFKEMGLEARIVEQLRGSATTKLSTEDILRLMRGDAAEV